MRQQRGNQLHYSRIKLSGLVAAGLAMAAFLVWVALDPAIVEGVSDPVSRSAGPDGARGLLLLAGAPMATVLLMNLRLVWPGGCVAAQADPDGISFRTLLGASRHPWREVEALFLKRLAPPSGPVLMLRPRTGRPRGIPLTSLREKREEVEAWIAAAENLRNAAR